MPQVTVDTAQTTTPICAPKSAGPQPAVGGLARRTADNSLAGVPVARTQRIVTNEHPIADGQHRTFLQIPMTRIPGPGEVEPVQRKQ